MFRKIRDRLKDKSTSREQESPSSGATVSEVPIPEPRGHDAKRLAEMKADAAGEKWRREAETRGEKPVEVGGPKGLEPTRYGDWEKAGRCIDF